MAHIAFCVPPLTGHVNPTLAVVTELVARGHRVTYATTGDFAERVTNAGAGPVLYPSTFTAPGHGPVQPFADPTRFTADDLARLLHRQLAEAVATLPVLHRKFATDRPDVLITDPVCWAGRLLARRSAIPMAHSQPVFAANEHWSVSAGRTDFDPAHPGLAEVTLGVRNLLRRLGVSSTVDEFFRGDTCAELVYIPRAFQYAGDTFSAGHHFVGPCIGPRTWYGSWTPPPGDKRIALVSLGTVYNGLSDVLRACVDAFDENWHVVVSLGGTQVGGLPPTAEVHTFVPQADVLAKADVFINHGGTGTVMEGLAAGVPSVVTPQMAEHCATADRLAELGLGTRLPSAGLTADEVRKAVDALTGDPDVRQNLAWMQGEIAAAGGAVAAADAIELLLGEA